MMVEADQGRFGTESIMTPLVKASKGRLLCYAASFALCVLTSVAIAVAVVFACEVRVDHSAPLLLSQKHAVIGTARALYPVDPQSLPGRDDVTLYSNLKHVNLHVNGIAAQLRSVFDLAEPHLLVCGGALRCLAGIPGYWLCMVQCYGHGSTSLV